MVNRTYSGWLAKLVAFAVMALLLPRYSAGADTPQVSLNTSKAGPRAVETLTERSILRDYKFAWTNLELALESKTDGFEG